MNLIKSLLLFALLALCAVGQITTPSTTLSSAITSTSQMVIQVASNSGFVLQSAASVGTYLYIDQEGMQIKALVSPTSCTTNCYYSVTRGDLGTKAATHTTVSTLWVGNPAAGSGDSSRPFTGAFPPVDPAVGSCTAANQTYLPVIAISTGRVWTCPTTGPLAGMWAVQYDPTSLFSLTDGALFLPYSACQTSVSGNSTGTNGYTTVGASNLGVVQASTSATGTNTHTYTCHLAIPTRLRGTAGAAVSDVVFLYGVQTSALGTQAATLASGTFNSTGVFGKIAFPAPAASETASTVAPARADSGSLVITPVAASWNTGATTAGAFYSAKFAPATPVLINTDLVDVTFTVTLQCAATSATVTNSPGLYVHVIGVPL